MAKWAGGVEEEEERERERERERSDGVDK